jgi:hypothetical protein
MNIINNDKSLTNQQQVQKQEQQDHTLEQQEKEKPQVVKQNNNEFKQLKKQITYSYGMRLDTKELNLDNLHRCNEIENLTNEETKNDSNSNNLKRTAEFENLTNLDDE